jgi:hypothetical protein
VKFLGWPVDDVNRYRRHAHYVLLIVQGVGIILKPEEKVHLMLQVVVGRPIAFAIKYLDQNGNEMVTPPMPDAAPAWSNKTPATETLQSSPDGTTCQATTLAPGTDEVDLSLSVGGKSFAAAFQVEVEAQVLTSIAIVGVAQ